MNSSLEMAISNEYFLNLEGDFRKQTHPLYEENSTNKCQTISKANKSILDMQGKRELCVRINRTF
jgi:hypothetical protein